MLAVADSKVILIMCLAKLRRDVHEFVWRNSLPNMLWYSSMKIFLMFHCWSRLGCLSIKSLKVWIDMNSKSKTEEISSATTLDGSNFSTRKLDPRKYFVACIWCIASRELCGEITILFGRLTPTCNKQAVARCICRSSPFRSQLGQRRAGNRSLDASPHLPVGWLLLQMHYYMPS